MTRIYVEVGADKPEASGAVLARSNTIYTHISLIWMEQIPLLQHLGMDGRGREAARQRSGPSPRDALGLRGSRIHQTGLIPALPRSSVIPAQKRAADDDVGSAQRSPNTPKSPRNKPNSTPAAQRVLIYFFFLSAHHIYPQLHSHNLAFARRTPPKPRELSCRLFASRSVACSPPTSLPAP
jgi:hypothetical protein